MGGSEETALKDLLTSGKSQVATPRARYVAYDSLGKGELMTVAQVDDFAARQILAVFARYKVTVGGVLRRHQFFEVRDGDFQRGIDGAVAKGWIEKHHRDRYRYILSIKGREAYDSVLTPMSTVAPSAEIIALRP